MGFAGLTVEGGDETGETTDAADVGDAFGGGDDAAGVKEVEGVGAFDDGVVGGEGEAGFDEAVAFGFVVGEVALLEGGVDEFEVVAGLFLFVLSMEVAVGQAAVPVDGVDVVTVLDEEGKAFEGRR